MPKINGRIPCNKGIFYFDNIQIIYYIDNNLKKALEMNTVPLSEWIEEIKEFTVGFKGFSFDYSDECLLVRHITAEYIRCIHEITKEQYTFRFDDNLELQMDDCGYVAVVDVKKIKKYSIKPFFHVVSNTSFENILMRKTDELCYKGKYEHI